MGSAWCRYGAVPSRKTAFTDRLPFLAPKGSNFSSRQTDGPSRTNPFPFPPFEADPESGFTSNPCPETPGWRSEIEPLLWFERVVFFREKLPRWGLKRREKVGLGAEKEKWVVKTREERRGEPKRPRPDFREREREREGRKERSGGGSGRVGEFERRAGSEVGGERKRDVRGVGDGGGDGGEEGVVEYGDWDFCCYNWLK